MSKAQNQYIHVIPHIERWVVKSESNKKATSVHPTQRDAIFAARKLAQSVKGELVIHARDGRVRERDSYCSDPLPPKSPRKVLFPSGKIKTKEREIRKAVNEVIKETQDKIKKDSWGIPKK